MTTFSVFARPASDGRTPEFVVMDRNVRVSDGFPTRAEAEAEAERREVTAAAHRVASQESRERINARKAVQS